MAEKDKTDGEMLKGTLDMMILRTLVTGDAHGHTVAKVIERTSEDVLEVEQGSLYPARHRLEDRGWVPPSGARARTIAKQSSTGSPLPAGNNSPVRRIVGGK
jgi:DNA-binding PadR family transcriptional regulator